jgi:hypothetical protein
MMLPVEMGVVFVVPLMLAGCNGVANIRDSLTPQKQEATKGAQQTTSSSPDPHGCTVYSFASTLNIKCPVSGLSNKPTNNTIEVVDGLRHLLEFQDVSWTQNHIKPNPLMQFSYKSILNKGCVFDAYAKGAVYHDEEQIGIFNIQVSPQTLKNEHIGKNFTYLSKDVKATRMVVNEISMTIYNQSDPAKNVRCN